MLKYLPLKTWLNSGKILALVMVSASLPTTAAAHDALAQGVSLDKYQARTLARKYLSTIGYSRPGTSTLTARVGEALRNDDVWEVKVRLGGNIPLHDAVVLVDAQSGEILEERP